MISHLSKLMVLSLVLLTGCSTVNKQMKTSNLIPAASGKVKANVADDGNTRLDLKVKHMAPPSKIRQDATNYVLWVRPGEGTQAIPQNIGTLLINDEMEGSLETITPLKVFNLFITAEYSAQTATPSGEELMWTNFPSGTLK